MGGIGAVARKELLEFMGSSPNQATHWISTLAFLVLLVVIGFMTYLADVALWAWAGIALMPAVMVLLNVIHVQESYSGERERHTLETLLAAPISERSILLGKVLAHGILNTAVVVGAFIALWLPVLFLAGGDRPIAPPVEALIAGIGLSFHAFLLIEAYGLFVAQRASTVVTGNTMVLPFLMLPGLMFAVLFMGSMTATDALQEEELWIHEVPTLVAASIPYLLVGTYIVVLVFLPFIWWANKAHRLMRS